jgi:hypothetical protein
MPGISLTLDNVSHYGVADWLDICDNVLNLLKAHTPIDTGYCIEQWEMLFDVKRTVFYNDCEYSSYLDDGWSKQSPNGMIQPTLQELASNVFGR